jgi:hypothetical protein
LWLRFLLEPVTGFTSGTDFKHQSDHGTELISSQLTPDPTSKFCNLGVQRRPPLLEVCWDKMIYNKAALLSPSFQKKHKRIAVFAVNILSIKQLNK